MGFFSKKSKKSTKNSKMEFGYWGIQGLGQPIRYLFKAANVEYKAVDYMEFPAWFAEAKPELLKETPFANLPWLRDGDLLMTQSGCILRYLGEKYGFAPTSTQGKVHVDMIHGTLVDFWTKNVKLIFDLENFDSVKEKIHGEMVGLLSQINSHLVGKKFIADERLTWVDFFYFYVLTVFTRWSSQIKDLSENERYMENVRQAGGQKMCEYYESILETQPIYPPGVTHESVQGPLSTFKQAF